LTSHDYERPGKPECAWDDPQARQALVSGLVNDALALLDAVADLELGAEQAEAVALLALVAGQDVEPGERPGSCPGSRADVVSGTGSYVGSRASRVTPGRHLRSKA
jgi:hypothetical protein